jgi:two-component system response regulator TtrR
MQETTIVSPEAEEALGVVYVVDDDEGVRDSLQYLLEASRYEVHTFASAESFLAQFDPHAIAVLVLDVRMPGMSGTDALREIKARLPAVEVLMLTGHAQLDVALAGMELGAFDYLLKPVDLDALLYRLQDAYRKKRLRESGGGQR